MIGSAVALVWNALPGEIRDVLDRKLVGLYNLAEAEPAFDSLAVDKQQALLILARRLDELGLWKSVERIENVYGKGGVGMAFIACENLKAELQQRADFTTRFARHRGAIEGWVERRAEHAALHLLFKDQRTMRWEAHFDLHSPMGSLWTAVRHLIYEKLRGIRPDWRVVAQSLGYFQR